MDSTEPIGVVCPVCPHRSDLVVMCRVTCRTPGQRNRHPDKKSSFPGRLYVVLQVFSASRSSQAGALFYLEVLVAMQKNLTLQGKTTTPFPDRRRCRGPCPACPIEPSDPPVSPFFALILLGCVLTACCPLSCAAEGGKLEKEAVAPKVAEGGHAATMMVCSRFRCR